MCVNTIPLVIGALFASLALAQTAAEPSVDRVLYFTYTEKVQDVQEIATAVRSKTGIRQVSIDASQRALALRGTADQVAIADWLFNELNKPANPQDLAAHEYRASGKSDDLVRVFYTRTETPQNLQELAVLIRSLADIPRVFTYNASKVITLRGTADQVALAEWLFNELDKGQSPAPHEYRAPGNRDDVARVFYPAHAGTPQRLQEIATLVRSTTGIRRLFIYTPPRALALHGTADQIAAAERLVKEQDTRNSP